MKIDSSPYYITIFFVLLGILPQALTAQSGQNPFDIDSNAPVQPLTKEELSPEPIAIPNPPADIDTSTASPRNPFETTPAKDSATPVLETTPITVNPSNLTTNPFEVAEGEINTAEIPPLPNTIPKDTVTEEEIPVITTKDVPLSSGILFILIVIMLVLFALMVTFFRSFFGRVYQAFLSDNQLGSAYREMGNTISPPYLFLYAMFLINASILVYVMLNYYGLSFYDGWMSILAILGTLCLIFLASIYFYSSSRAFFQ